MMICFQKNGKSLARNFMCMALFFSLVLIPISTKAEIIIPIDHYPDESDQVIRPSEAYDEDISSYAHIRAVPNAEPLITYDFDPINSGDSTFLNMRVFSENFTNDTWGIKYSLYGGADGTWITLKEMSSENIVIYLDIRENIGALDTSNSLSIGIFTDTKGKVDGGTINIYEIFAEAATSGSAEPSLYQSSYRFFENLSLGVAGVDEARSIATYGEFMYIAGFQPGGWRIEQRDLSDGTLEYSDENICAGEPRAILAHNGSIFIVGDDYTDGNYQWRIEKRDAENLELDPSFGDGGFVLSNPSEGGDTAYDIVIVDSSIYIVGSDRTHGDSQWRIEKRALTDGSLVSEILSNPSNDNDVPYAIAHAIVGGEGYLYIGGYDRDTKISTNPGKAKKETSNAQWRLEKRPLTDLSQVQIMQFNPTGNFDAIKDIAVDDDYIYLVGYQEEGFFDTAWRVEKRHLSDLELEEDSFGTRETPIPTPGFKIIDPGYHDSPESIVIDDAHIYIAGFSADEGSSGDTAWRIEKWDKIDGDEVYSIVHDIDSDYNDRAYGIALATVGTDNYMYIAGYEQPGLADWRIEIRNASDGDLVVPLPQPLADQNNPADVDADEPFLLKILIQVADNDLPLGQGVFKLQVAAECLRKAYIDVGHVDSGILFNQAIGTDGSAAKPTGEDPFNIGETTSYQSYEIENPFINGVSEILDGENGLWEFSLIPKTAGNYCFRIVNNDNTELDGYDLYPEINVLSP
jgi:hypothetical protein